MPDRLGPLPPLLIAFTVVTGIVDAVSFLGLGHVFVANMTGNIIFLGLAAAGVPGVSAATSLVSIAAFLVAGIAGGRLVRARHHRGRLLADCAAAELVLLVAGVAVAASSDAEPAHLALIVLLALAMGLQNAVARALAVPDLITTVLTMTLTGLAADSRLGGGAGANNGRRLAAVFAMFVGAFIGALLLLRVSSFAALAAAAIILAGSWAFAFSRARREPDGAWGAFPGR
ncbi:MAG TPA: YoaK family protein [Candidatus Elarobacter sp.]